MVKIKYSEEVVACRIGDVIFINPDLRKGSQEFLKSIIKHENQHTSGFGLKDIILDLNNKELKGFKKEYWTFFFKHPKTWKGLLCISKLNGRWTFDFSIFLINILFLLVLFGLIKFL